jgi:hypothetical protein
MSPLSSAPRPSPSRLGLLAAGLLLLLLAALLRLQGAPPRAAEREPPLPFRPDRKAHNPARIVLLAHLPGVLGWISGSDDHRGKSVTVSDGPRETQVKVQPGGFFEYRLQVARPTRLTFSLGDLESEIELRPQDELPRSVFFVLDRSVYRPKQALRFAAFVRKLNDRGEFVPVSCPVELVLTHAARKTAVARLRRTADEMGRVTGEYTFTASDPLGQYTLSTTDFLGSAELSLAEYRKTPMRLTLERHRQGSELKLRFRGRDYLGQPVPGGRVQLTAQVIREPARPPRPPLDAREYVYAGQGPPALRLEDLGVEEGLLAETGGERKLVLGLGDEPRKVVKEIKGEANLDGHGEGTYTLTLHRKWIEQRHLLAVQAVLLDPTGREVRKSQTLPIDEEADLRLSLPRTHFFTDEPIRVQLHGPDDGKVKGRANLVVMKLSTRLPAANPPPMGASMMGFGGGMMGMMGVGPYPPGSPPPTKPLARDAWLERSLFTVEPFLGDAATVRIDEPGAYMLVALVVQPDGTRLRQEVGCIVEPIRQKPALELRLDRHTWTAGKTLRGTVYSRYDGAQVLLLLRDSRGIQLAWRQCLDGGSAKIEQKLPDDLGYGCYVEAQYCDSLDGPTHVVSRLIHVLPEPRRLTIRSKVKPVVEPGEKVAVELEVNRKEAVDLVVSVYDQALLTIAPDTSKEIVDFYLADDRVRQSEGLEVLRRQLGDVTIGRLLSLGRQESRRTRDKEKEADFTLLQADTRNGRALTTFDVATLLRLAGLRVRWVGSDSTPWSPRGTPHWHLPSGRSLNEMKLADLFDRTENGWRLQVALLRDTFLLSEYHPNDQPNPWQSAPFYDSLYPAWPPVGFTGFPGNMMGWPNGVMGGMGMMGGGIGIPQGAIGGGFNQMGGQGASNLGVGGGVVGFGGMPGMPLGVPRPRFVAHQVGTPVVLADTDEGPPVQVRRDFSDSAFWHSRVRTDAAGKAWVEFRLPESLTTWRVVVTGVSKEMHVGQHTASFRTARPLMVHPLVPRFFVEGDRVTVAVGVHNYEDARKFVRIRLKADGVVLQEDADKEITLRPWERSTVSWQVKAGKAGEARLEFTASGKEGGDAALKKVPILRGGAERIVTVSGFCKKPLPFRLPEGVDPKTVRLEARFMPAMTADLLDTLDYLVDYPYGCVEQTMSRFLPAIKVAQLLKRLQLEDPRLAQKLPACVQQGMGRLLQFQHADGGWGWYETDPTHEIMTPYALYGLIEAEKAGYALPEAEAIPRGLRRLAQYIEEPHGINTANRVYCMYVYGQRKPLSPRWWEQLDHWLSANELSDYALALSLELAAEHHKADLARRLAKRLRARARGGDDRVHWQTAGLSHWADDPFEVTAAALKALVAHDKDDKLIPGTIQFFMASKRDTHWNSTKDTAMILYALCDYLARQEADPKEPPALRFRCNDAPAVEVPFLRVTEPKTITLTAEQVHAGLNRLTFPDARPQVMVRLVLRYWEEGKDLAPDSHGLRVGRTFWLLDDHGKRLRRLESGEAVPRGSYLESVVTVAAEDSGQALRYLVVENRKPAGCETVPAADRRFSPQTSPCLLREDRDQLVAFHHLEVQGLLTDSCVLLAETAGDYLVPAARAEMMYQTDVHGHSGTFALRVVER